MFRLAALLGLVGLAAATCLIVWSGWAQVAQSLAQAGWGIIAVALFHGVILLISSASWQVLIPGKHKPSLQKFFYFMWIRAAVNNLMPVARIGGEIAAVRMMEAHGMRRSIAIGSTVVELTMSIMAVFLFVLTGVILFALHVNNHNLLVQLGLGLVVSLSAIAALVFVQRIGFFVLLSRLFRIMFKDKWADMVGSAARFDRAVTVIYYRKKRVLICGLMQIVAWSLGSVEISLALYFLGQPLPLHECVMLEALIQGSASAAFAVPGALGVQEAGFLIFGGMLGLPREVAAALAIMRRCRDLLLYVPGLVAWQVFEGKKLLK